MNRTDNLASMVASGPHRLVLVRNTESTAVPPFGAMAITGRDDDTGAVTVGKPTLNGQTDVYFNGPTAIPAGLKGQAVSGLPCVAAYSSDNDEGLPPTAGEHWGCVAGSWLLSRHQPGFVAQSDGTGGIVEVRPMTTALAGFVEVADGYPDDPEDGRYHGVEQSYDPEAKTWSDGTECWVVDCNGGLIHKGARFPAILVGFAAGKRVWSMMASVCGWLTTLPTYDGSVVQLLGHDADDVCQWYTVDECP